MTDLPEEISTAYEFQPGKVYGLQLKQWVPHETREKLAEWVQNANEYWHVEFIIFPHYVEVVAPPEAKEDDKPYLTLDELNQWADKRLAREQAVIDEKRA